MQPFGSRAHLSVQFAVSRQHVEVKRMRKHVPRSYLHLLKRDLSVTVVPLRWGWNRYWKGSPVIISVLAVAGFGYKESKRCYLLNIILYLVLVQLCYKLRLSDLMLSFSFLPKWKPWEKNLSWCGKRSTLFNTLFKPFLKLSVKGNLQNILYSFCSSFYHWQMDNRNVLGQSWCFWRWCMRKRVSSSIPSWQTYSAGPRGRNKLPGEGYWPERLFESIYCSGLSIAAKNRCFLIQSGKGRITAPHCLVFAGLYLFRAKVTRAETMPGLFLWVIWAQGVLWWNNCSSAICLTSNFQNWLFFQEITAGVHMRTV